MDFTPNVFTVSNVVTDALMRALVGMSPKTVPFEERVVPHSKPTPESGKLVIFVGYTKEENASIIKSWSEYIVQGECSVFIMKDVKTPSDSILVSPEYGDALGELYSPSQDVYYMPSFGDSDDLEDLVGESERNRFDYIIIESASILEDAVSDILTSLRKITGEFHSNAVISMTHDEFALIANNVDLFDVVICKGM